MATINGNKKKKHWAQSPAAKAKLSQQAKARWARIRAEKAQAAKAGNGNLVEMVRQFETLRKQIVEKIGGLAA